MTLLPRATSALLAAGALLASAASCDRGTAAGAAESLPATYGSVPPFSLVERSGKTVTLDDLRGRVWIADFVFTRCAGPCPRMTGAMARLAAEIDSKDARFVSISVDPEHDSPAVLAAYAASYGADPERWIFLTGDPGAVSSLCRDGFKLGYAAAPADAAPPGAAFDVAHSTRFVLVDRDARIAGYFDAEDEGALERLRRAAEALLR